ncbi:MAG: FkbM family methyltransferase, partial [Cytophagia bacterium]|nr:FkbM family methyltransferase [Cytophagia bacterium]
FEKSIKSNNIFLEKIAIGAENGKIIFNQSSGAEHIDPEGWDHSGSIRKPKSHLEIWPWVTFKQQIEVPIFRLDDWAKDKNLINIDFIWADVQGAEGDLIAGAKQTLNKTRFFYTEFSDEEWYEGQVNFETIEKSLENFSILHKFKNDVLFVSNAEIYRSIEEQINRAETVNRSSQSIIGSIINTTQGVYSHPLNENVITHSLIQTGQYEDWEIKLISNVVNAEDSVLIVGAHLGAIAIPVSKLVRRLELVEANPEIIKYLKCNIILNDIKNINLTEIAASNENEDLSFIAGEGNSGGSKIYPKIAHPHYFESKHKIVKVKAKPLDEVYSEGNFKLVFMDIEGSEFAALKGMQRILTLTQFLFIEFIPHHLQYVADTTPELFADEILKYFSHLYVPKLNATLDAQTIKIGLRKFFDLNYSFDQIIFYKKPEDINKIMGNL